jgi:hypothetical protein
MTAKTFTKIISNVWFAIGASVVIVMLSFISFIMAEPQISHSQDATSEFFVRTTILGEATFLVEPTDVIATGTINGITGGNATGTTQFVVQSNSAGGHYVTISFFDNPGQYAMYGDNTQFEDIFDYNFGGAEPTYGFTPEPNASFAYTVTSTSPGDTDDSFDHNGVNACDTPGTDGDGTCWMTPSTSQFRIVDTSGPAPNGATSSIQFRVNVPSGASPAVGAGTYTATATLSLYSQ